MSELSILALAFGLGLLYLTLGITVILNARFRWGLFGRLSLGWLLPRGGYQSLGLGFVFGLNLPACAYPLLLVLLVHIQSRFRVVSYSNGYETSNLRTYALQGRA